jgi:uncharacterized protein YndB with AHSA1/START domain
MAEVVLTEEDVTVKVCLRVKKPVPEVFTAVVQPELMSQYFISEGSAPLVAGTTVTWTFADFNAVKEVKVLEMVENERIVLLWNAAGVDNRVELHFSVPVEGVTLIKIRESCLPLDAAAVQRVRGQTYGWTHFLFTLKAFVELGVNLRVGSVDPADMA